MPPDRPLLASCSHFLFLYSEHLSLSFHCEAIREMCRVAKEVRVFPLLTLDGVQSPHLEGVYRFLTDSKHLFSIRTVDYEFQRGGDKMLSVGSLEQYQTSQIFERRNPT